MTVTDENKIFTAMFILVKIVMIYIHLNNYFLNSVSAISTLYYYYITRTNEEELLL